MPNTRPNPYLGPRSFLPGEPLYGRDTETRKLANLLSAERIVLLHSPSGAGKTSLIQAALIPKMLARKFHVWPIIRVNTELRQGPAANRYVFSVLSALETAYPEAEQLPAATLATLSFGDYFARRPPPAELKYGLLIFDQFEEVLTLDPNDRAAKQAFFEQLGQLLEDRTRWALFAMREDYLGALAPYVLALPNRLRATFRLDLLDEAAAQQALQKPAERVGVSFPAETAQMLVDDLRRVRVQQPDGSVEMQLGLYVEPVQLQVVAYRLWESLANEDLSIDPADLRALGDVGQALADYYAGRVAHIAASTGVSERTIREWCDQQLITEQGLRGQVLLGREQSSGLDNRAVRALENAHLVRGERRSGALWYELAHDRLIEPVRASNAAWFKANLNLLQSQAELWERQQRTANVLLRGKGMVQIEAEARTMRLTPTEADFLAACRTLRAREQRQRYVVGGLLGGLAVILLFLWLSLPSIKTFTAIGPDAATVVDAFSKETLFIDGWETARLTWEAAPFFSELRLVNQDTKETLDEIDPAYEPQGYLVVSPTFNTQYQLEANTWLSRIYPSLKAVAVIPISVQPIKPHWVSYIGGEVHIVRGQEMAYTWKVEHAEAVFLVERVNYVETRVPVPAEMMSEGSIVLAPVTDTTYYLTAHNRYTSEQGEVTPEQFIIKVLDPTATPLPAPVIMRFDVSPTVITVGESVRVEWAVAGVVPGVTQVRINGVEQAPQGSLELFPSENTVYSIQASNGDLQDTKSVPIQVKPAPSPTPK